MPTLLIIDDEPSVARAIQPGLRNLKVEVLTAETAADGLELAVQQRPDALLLDIGLPDMSGLELFKQVSQRDARIPTIVMTGKGTIETAIQAMKLGALDYIHKPFTFGRIRQLVLRAFAVGRMMRQPVIMPDETSPEDGSADLMIGRCEAMQEVYKAIGLMAPQEGTVLIRGESGTGKELVARAIYQHSRRSEAPFLAINCAAIPESLLESELFGHEKGAFTGAEQRRVGKFEQCSGGTIFLDEIGDMSPLTQAKVLRALQQQQFERVGGTDTIQTDVRAIAATNRPLEQMVKDGRFRADLYYRLNVFTIRLPPLRERIEDLPLLVDHFLQRHAGQMQRDVRTAAPEVVEILARYSWPGNLRELQSVLKQALLGAIGSVLLPEFLPGQVRETKSPAAPAEAAGERIDWDEFLSERLRAESQNLYNEWFARMERHLLTRTLQHTGGNQSQAAAILGITRRSLRNKIRGHGIAIERSVSSDEELEEPDERSL